MGGRREVLLRFPLEESGARSDGLLAVALEAAPIEPPAQQLRILRRELPRLLRDPIASEILNRPRGQLNQGDIRRLFEAIERIIEARLSEGGRHAAASGCTYIFRHFAQPLGDGSLIGQSGFKSKFESNRPRKEPADLDTAAEEEVAAVTFENFTERKAKAHAIFQRKKASILRQCEEHLDVYESTCEELGRVEALGLESLPTRVVTRLTAGKEITRKAFEKLPDAQKLQVTVYLAKECGAHLSRPPADKLGLRPALVPQLKPLALGEGHLACFEALLARHYLPKSVVYACLSILVLETALNRDTLLTMKYSNVRRQGQGFQLHGVKPKTDQLQTRNVFSSADNTLEEEQHPLEVQGNSAIRAITLLMANCERYIEHTGASDPPLFSVHSLRTFPAPLTLGETQFTEVRNHRPDWRFNVVQLRNLAAQVNYTSPEGDIFSVQALLQHAQPGTSAGYLEDIVVKWLHQANINRYMKMLAATILWVVDREDLIEQHALRLFIHRPLLFPLMPGNGSSVSSAVDAWIASSGKNILTIGTDEIHHIALQQRFYRDHAKRLARDNPKAFLRHDLPRIVVCLALRRVIESSRHAAVLRAFEEHLA